MEKGRNSDKKSPPVTTDESPPVKRVIHGVVLGWYYLITNAASRLQAYVGVNLGALLQ